MTDYLSLAIIGAVVSLIVQVIKNSAGTSRNQTVATVIVLSALAGGAYYFFQGTAVWQAGLQILLFANAVYGFLISRFE
jgi:hypothetical protein